VTRRAALAALGLLLAGADGGSCEGARRIEAEVLRAGSDCGGRERGPSAEVVATRERWSEIFPPLLGADPAPPKLDLSSQAIVVVRMGERPTGGHAVELRSRDVAVKKGVAALAVAFRAPAADALVTQALTRPCLAVRLPREGLREVKVVDAGGDVVAAAKLR
jgi:hypothetical protein